MKLLNFTLIKLTLCLVIGIYIGYYITIPLQLSLYTSLSLICLLFLCFLYLKNRFKNSIWFGLITFITTISIGVLTHNLHDEKQFYNHYTKVVEIDESASKEITFRIRKQLKPGNYYNKYIIDILKVDSTIVNGKSLLNIEKDSTLRRLKTDDIYITYSHIKDLINPLNPNQFNYKNYLEKQYIYHQIFTNQQSIYKTKSKSNTIFGYAAALRNTINAKLKTYNFAPDELAIINALLLGQRQDISEDVYNNYTNAGAIHILAVSGLHVGIILLLLNVLLKPLERLRHGKPIKILCILLLLWSFAIIAGLSASVTRAVTMFSIVAIAINWKRPTNIYNTLAISIFILLLIKPMFLFDVGFQLSYLAVIAIVTFQPILYKLWSTKIKPLDYFWQIFTVTVSAQFGIIPVSLYYFHQFPSLFFISNLAIIPFLGLILGLGILVIVLAVLNSLPEFLANFFGSTINAMNLIVAWVSKQETFLFRDIPFSLAHVLSSYLIVASLFVLNKKRNFKSLTFMLIAIMVFQGVLIYTKYETSNKQFIVFHKSRYSLITEKSNRNMIVYHNLDSTSFKNDKVIKNYRVGNFIESFKTDSLKSIYKVQNKMVLVVDSLGVYNVTAFKPNYVLLRNSPKINLQRLIDSIQPEVIIADGSNYKSYIKRWKATCLKQKLPFHQTSEKGAFIIE